MTDEEVESVMDPLWGKMEKLIQEKYAVPLCISNADKSGMFYEKTLNDAYVGKNYKNDLSGTKQMKDKLRMTAMIATAADGSRLPFTIIGKQKNPVCFQLLGIDE